MALKAEVRLSCREEILGFVRRVDAVATDAANIAFAMGRALNNNVLAGVAL